jgi:hypothetical protein
MTGSSVHRHAQQQQAQQLARMRAATQRTHEAAAQRQRETANDRIRQSMRQRHFERALASADQAGTPAPSRSHGSSGRGRGRIAALACAAIAAAAAGAGAAALYAHISPNASAGTPREGMAGTSLIELRVHPAPSAASPVLGHLNIGERIVVACTSAEGWDQLTGRNAGRWAFGRYIRTAGTPARCGDV